MSSNRPLHLRRLLILAPLAAAGLLAGCATERPGRAGFDQAITPTEQYPLKVREAPAELRLAPHPQGLSPAQREALAGLAARWTQEGGGPVSIRVPTHPADLRAADATSREAMDVLVGQGVPPEEIRRVGYEAGGPGGAPVIVGYAAYEAVIPRCGLKWGNLTSNPDNRPMENFGCAVSANLAAQIANPADIARPQAMESTDAGRQATVIGKYRQGQPTAAATEAGASGSISNVGAGAGGGGGSQ